MRRRRLLGALATLLLTAPLLARPAYADLKELASRFANFFGVPISLTGGATTVDVPGAYPVGPFTIGSPVKGKGIRVTVPDDLQSLVVAAPILFTVAPSLRCDATLRLTSKDVSLECAVKMLMMDVVLKASLAYNFKTWELAGDGALVVLGVSLGGAHFRINQDGIEISGKLSLAGQSVEVNGHANYRLSDFSLAGTLHGIRIPGLGDLFDVGVELSPEGVSASFSVLGIGLSVGPISPKQLLQAIVDEALSLLNPIKLIENVAKAVKGAAVAAAKEVVHAATTAWNTSVSVAKALWDGFTNMANWAAGVIASAINLLENLTCASTFGLSDTFGITDCKGKREDAQRRADDARAREAAARAAAEEADRKAELAAETLARIKRASVAPAVEAEGDLHAMKVLRRAGLTPFLECPRLKVDLGNPNDLSVWATVELLAKKMPEDLAAMSQAEVDAARVDNCRRYFDRVPHAIVAAWQNAQHRRWLRGFGLADVRLCASGAPACKSAMEPMVLSAQARRTLATLVDAYGRPRPAFQGSSPLLSAAQRFTEWNGMEHVVRKPKPVGPPCSQTAALVWKWQRHPFFAKRPTLADVYARDLDRKNAADVKARCATIARGGWDELLQRVTLAAPKVRDMPALAPAPAPMIFMRPPAPTFIKLPPR